MMEQQLLYQHKKYKILCAEQEFITHPAALGLAPLSKASLQSSYSCEFHIEDYRLILDTLTIMEGDSPQVVTIEDQIYYNGAILLGANMAKEYLWKNGKLADFSYQNVLELIFDKGMLITTIDQSKAMLRIRKNLELGLRNLNNNKDIRCIRRFLNASLVGDYKPFFLDSSRIRYLKEMKDKNQK